MKRYTLSGADSLSHVPEHPERTAMRQHQRMNFDVTYQVWPNRPAMLKSLEMQEQRAPRFDDWKPCRIPSDGRS